MPSSTIDDVLAHLDQALRPLDRELGDLRVLVGGAVERARDHLAAQHVAPHVGDLFGPLVDEQHHEVHLGVVALDRVDELLEDRGLARLRRRHDEAALALADRRDQVDDPAGHLAAARRAARGAASIGEQRREVLEPRAVAGVVGRQAVDVVDPQQRGVLLVARLRARRAGDEVALAQREAPHLRRRHVDVLLRGQVAVAAEEAVALVAEVEQALHLDRLALVLAPDGRRPRAGPGRRGRDAGAARVGCRRRTTAARPRGRRRRRRAGVVVVGPESAPPSASSSTSRRRRSSVSASVAVVGVAGRSSVASVGIDRSGRGRGAPRRARHRRLVVASRRRRARSPRRRARRGRPPAPARPAPSARAAASAGAARGRRLGCGATAHRRWRRRGWRRSGRPCASAWRPSPRWRPRWCGARRGPCRRAPIGRSAAPGHALSLDPTRHRAR